MGNIGDPIVSGSIPAVGTAGTTYASQINLFLTEVKSRLETAIPKGSLAAGDLDMNGSFVKNAGYLGLSDAGLTPTTPTNTFQMHNGEVYWVSPSGVVKITNSGSLNAGSIGGITGDYGGVNPAQLRFVDADQEYYFYDDYAGGAYGYIWARGIDLAKNATSATRVRVISPSTLTSNYTLTLPNTPSTTTLLQMDSSGTIAPATTAVYVRDVPAVSGQGSGFAAAGTYGSYMVNSATGTSKTLTIPIQLDIGAVVNSLALDVVKNSGGTQTLTFTAAKVDSAGTETSIASTSSTGTGALTLTLSTPFTVTSGTQYVLWINVTHATSLVSDNVLGARVNYSQPMRAV